MTYAASVGIWVLTEQKSLVRLYLYIVPWSQADWIAIIPFCMVWQDVTGLDWLQSMDGLQPVQNSMARVIVTRSHPFAHGPAFA